MNNNVTYRAFRESDSKAIEGILRHTWKFDTFSSPKAAELTAKIFLLGVLSNHNYAYVAEKDNVPLGIIVVNNNKAKKFHIKYMSKLIVSIFPVLVKKDYRHLAKWGLMLEKINTKLLKDTAKTYDGEIGLFAVSEESRGLGIGKKLFYRAKDYMQKENLKNYYLFTDTTCTYQFYEKQEMKKMGTIADKHPLSDEDMQWFIYEQKLEEIW